MEEEGRRKEDRRREKGEGGRMRLSGAERSEGEAYIRCLSGVSPSLSSLSSLTWHNQPYTVQSEMVSVERQVVPGRGSLWGEPTTC